MILTDQCLSTADKADTCLYSRQFFHFDLNQRRKDLKPQVTSGDDSDALTGRVHDGSLQSIDLSQNIVMSCQIKRDQTT